MNKDLRKRTDGEELWLYRRSLKLTAAYMAKRLGVGRTTYWTWERDLAEVPDASLRSVSQNAKPTMDLLLALARRRQGGTLADTAGLAGCSHVILLKREREGDDGLKAWWKSKGFIF